MRPLQPFASYVDNTGALLVGRVRFYNLDGSPAEVKQKDGNTYTSLGASVFTDSSGRTVPQVFLEDHDYQLFFDKYVGAGTMAEDDDPESWEEQGSAIDTYQTFGISLEADSIRALSDIAALRGTQGVSKNEIVAVMGYNTSGDCDPVYYRWDTNSVADDDGGSVIQRNTPGVGRWVMVGCPEYLDVRHFGAFPLQGKVADATQRYAIQLAGAYAHSNGCGLYFPATELAIYYDISGLELYDVKANPNAMVFCASTMTSTITGIDGVHCTSGTNCLGLITLVDNVVRTSWGGDSLYVRYSPTEKLIIDSRLHTQATYRRWSNIRVELHVDSPQMQFDGCVIEANKVITSQIRILNCELKTEWFVDNYSFGSGLYSLGNKIHLRNCKDATTYILLKNKQREANYGDLGEQVVSNVTLLAGCIAENAQFDSVSLAGSSELHNCSGTIASLAQVGTHNWIDCWIAFLDDVVVGPFQMLRGSISSDHSVTFTGTFNLDGVTVNPNITVTGTVVAEDSEFLGTVMCLAIQSTGCTYIHDITVFARTNLSVVFVGNTIARTCTMHLTVDEGYTDVKAVGCVWQNNTVLPRQEPSTFWLRVDSVAFDQDDSHHDYSYRDNSGAMPTYGRKTGLTRGAYGWGSREAGGNVTLAAYLAQPNGTQLLTVGTHWQLEAQILTTDGLVIPNTFAIGSFNATKTCSVRLCIHAVDSEGNGGDEYYEFPATVHMKTGVVYCDIQKLRLNMIAICGVDEETHICSPLSFLWEWNENTHKIYLKDTSALREWDISAVATVSSPWK